MAGTVYDGDVSSFDCLSSRWTLFAIATATIVLAVALPATFALNSPPRGASDSRPALIDDGNTPETARGSDPPVTAGPIAPAQGLPIGRWAVLGGAQFAGQQVAEIEFGDEGRFTGRSSAGQTAFAGRWGGETGTLKATGTSLVQPAVSFECDLVYVEATKRPQSSYVLGDCRGGRERWTLELYRASAR